MDPGFELEVFCATLVLYTDFSPAGCPWLPFSELFPHLPETNKYFSSGSKFLRGLCPPSAAILVPE